MKAFLVNVNFLVIAILFLKAQKGDAFMEGFSQSIGMMNQQLTKFMEGLQQSVNVWANKVIDNANKEECFYICPKGVCITKVSLQLHSSFFY